MEILKTSDLTKYYSHNGTVTKAVDHVNISICKGEYVSIIGQSGAGKSTLLNLLGGKNGQTEDAKKVLGSSLIDSLRDDTTIETSGNGDD